MSKPIKALLYGAVIVVTALCALFLGRYPIPFSEIIKVLTNPAEMEKTTRIILFTVRLPRIVAALFVGAALAGSGAVYQTVFKNPMVSPSVLGASSGAAFGAALGLLLGFGPYMVQLMSFLSGLAAVFMALGVSAMGKQMNKVLLLVLAGMLVSTFFTALISLVKFLADPQNTLPAITYWLMGSLADSDLKRGLFIGGTVILSGIILYLLRWRISLLSLSDEEVRSMGVDPASIRLVVVIAATLMTSAAVSISGVIGWVGLVVPHMVRLRGANRFSSLLVGTLFGGGVYLLLIDTLCRVITPVEFPLGILTSLIGAPFFAFFLLRRRK
ncbi:MAG: iron ABC transporter permease [Spirochaetales bacterium]|nr:iron ABC transporter permease [Spirochaetales bacterium]